MQPFFETVGVLSRELAQAQGPIRILDAVKWSSAVENDFLQGRGQRLPRVESGYYQQNSLNFYVNDKLAELEQLRRRIERLVGDADGLGQLLGEMVGDYIQVVQMLAARGTRQFGERSVALWGSTLTPLSGSELSLLGHAELFHGHWHSTPNVPLEKTRTAPEVVDELRRRFQSHLFLRQIDVRLSDGIVADAAAGGRTIKIRPDALFANEDIDILEVHEGHTHVATSLNGRAQPFAPFLAFGPPRSTSTQEGLAVLMEVLTMSTYPARVKKINDRVRIIAMAEQGADANEVYRFLLEENYSESDAYRMMMRIFRGTDGRGGAVFAKDSSYLKGLIECYSFVQYCLQHNSHHLLHCLFAGKMMLKDVPTLMFHMQKGLVMAAPWLPPVFASTSALQQALAAPARVGLPWEGVFLQKLNDRLSNIFATGFLNAFKTG